MANVKKLGTLSALININFIVNYTDMLDEFQCLKCLLHYYLLVSTLLLIT